MVRRRRQGTVAGPISVGNRPIHDVQSQFDHHHQAAVIGLFPVINRYVGNLPPMPDYPAPVVRNAGTECELSMLLWIMPPPRAGGFPVTNPQHLVAATLWSRGHQVVRPNGSGAGSCAPGPPTRWGFSSGQGLGGHQPEAGNRRFTEPIVSAGVP